MQAISGCRGLYARPVNFPALAWSEDNLLAVASGPSALICNPADLSGPRSFTAPVVPGAPHLLADVVPSNYTENLQYHLRTLSGATSASKAGSQPASSVRAVAWSPSGCTASGGCLLTIVTEDHKVGC